MVRRLEVRQFTESLGETRELKNGWRTSRTAGAILAVDKCSSCLEQQQTFILFKLLFDIWVENYIHYLK